MNKSQTLIAAYDDLTWENYVDIADSITTFDKHAIDDEMTRQASVYSYYQGLLSVAKNHLDEASLCLTTYTAHSRKDQKGATVAKQTAKDLDDFVEASEGFLHYSRDVVDAQFKYTLLKGLVSALDHKKDMLIQLSSNRRSETKMYQ